METKKLTVQGIREKLSSVGGEYKDNELITLRVNNLLDLLKDISDEDIAKIKCYQYFVSIRKNPSDLNILSGILEQMLEDTRVYKQEKEQQAQEQKLKIGQMTKELALLNRRKSRQGVVITIMVILGILTGAAIVLGVLGAIGKIPAYWSDIIGTFDCALGIIFFIYELGADKLAESKIDSLDADIIQKHVDLEELEKHLGSVNIQKSVIKTGDIKNSPGSFINSTGFIGSVNIGTSSNEGTSQEVGTSSKGDERDILPKGIEDIKGLIDYLKKI